MQKNAMFLEEIETKEAYNLSPHHHAFINPYNGCSMGCPFCYWLSQEGWEKRIQIKTNIGEVLEAKLKTWPKNEFIYLGSVCDPFNELEGKYRLSKGCLELIRNYEIPLLITTSAADSIILEYIELIRTMKQRVIVVVELSRIPFIEEMNKGREHKGIVHANELKKAGIETWATLAPILPGITDLEQVLSSLDAEIPVYVDALNCTVDNIQGQRTLQWIEDEYPYLLEQYQYMIERQDWSYFEELMVKYKGEVRVKRFPFQLGED